MSSSGDDVDEAHGRFMEQHHVAHVPLLHADTFLVTRNEPAAAPIFGVASNIIDDVDELPAPAFDTQLPSERIVRYCACLLGCMNEVYFPANYCDTCGLCGPDGTGPHGCECHPACPGYYCGVDFNSGNNGVLVTTPPPLPTRPDDSGSSSDEEIERIHKRSVSSSMAEAERAKRSVWKESADKAEAALIFRSKEQSIISRQFAVSISRGLQQRRRAEIALHNTLTFQGLPTEDAHFAPGRAVPRLRRRVEPRLRILEQSEHKYSSCALLPQSFTDPRVLDYEQNGFEPRALSDPDPQLKRTSACGSGQSAVTTLRECWIAAPVEITEAPLPLENVGNSLGQVELRNSLSVADVSHHLLLNVATLPPARNDTVNSRAMRKQHRQYVASLKLIGLLPVICIEYLYGKGDGTFVSDPFAVVAYAAKYGAKWTVDTLLAAASTLSALVLHASLLDAYTEAEACSFSAPTVLSFLNSTDMKAIGDANFRLSELRRAGVEPTVQQSRRDGTSAENRAFQALKFLAKNYRLETAADHLTVTNRPKRATRESIPTPSATPAMLGQLAHLANTSPSCFVRGLSGGMHNVALMVTRGEQAAATSVVSLENSYVTCAIHSEKSNEPQKKKPRPAWFPQDDVLGNCTSYSSMVEMLIGVERGNFLLRDTNSVDGNPFHASCTEWASCALEGKRANVALHALLAAAPLSLSEELAASYDMHSLKHTLMETGAAIGSDVLKRHQIGGYSGSALRLRGLMPDAALMLQHRFTCAKMPLRYAQEARVLEIIDTIEEHIAPVRALLRARPFETLTKTGLGAWKELRDHHRSPDA